MLKEKVNKLKKYIENKNLDFYFSITISIIVAIFNLFLTIFSYSSYFLMYTIFYFLLVIFRIVIFKYNKKYKNNKNIRYLYLLTALSILLLISPMISAFISTFNFRETYHYVFYWIPYVYGLFSLVKLVNTIEFIYKERKSKDVYKICIKHLTVLSTLYTLQMLEFALIRLNEDSLDTNIYYFELYTQGLIFLICIVTIIHLIILFFTTNKKKQKNQTNNK